MTERQRMANLLFKYGEIAEDQWILEGDVITMGDKVSISVFKTE